jgi:hypothetical protein
MEGDSPDGVPQGPPVDGALPARQPCTYGLKFADIDGVVVGGEVVFVGYLAIGGEMDEILASASVEFITRLRLKRHNRKLVSNALTADKHCFPWRNAVECNTIQSGSVKG